MQKQLKTTIKPNYKKKIQRKVKFYNIQKRNKIIATFKKTRTNIFLTIMNKRGGEVLLTLSAGNCKIRTKKKKKSFDTVKTVAQSIARLAVFKNIRIIDTLYITHSYLKNSYILFYTFKSQGLMVKEARYIKKKPHALPLKKKKRRRL